MVRQAKAQPQSRTHHFYLLASELDHMCACAVTPRRAIVRKPRAIAFTQTEMGKIVKSPRRKLAETIAQKNGLPSLPTMIEMGVVPAGQVELVVKGRTHQVYMFPDGTPWL